MISRRDEADVEAGLDTTVADISREMHRRGRSENKPRQEDIDAAIDQVRDLMRRDGSGSGGFAVRAFAAQVGDALKNGDGKVLEFYAAARRRYNANAFRRASVARGYTDTSE